MDANHQIRALSDRLNLSNEAQDWGIINSDSSRIEEFLRPCDEAELTPVQQYAMSELVFASLNDALVERAAAPQVVSDFERFLGKDFCGRSSQIRYWSSLDNSDEFPIAELLRRLAALA